ncbi:glycerol-3-phosphate dehydrogenase C-terminal domain-containing protein, partial [Roseibium sp.]|uniref:glycerol-3-phosphate dehydrogenase C-terminal domain-containing protein n=1 Tax=Roseibium sp. TaxID=1936156 RepID=UPI003D0F76A7
HFTKRLEGAVPQLCMVGGKWTTFRAFAEQTADEVLRELRMPRKVGTLELPVGGGAGFPEDRAELERDLVSDLGCDPDRAAYLVSVYGTAAHKVLSFCAQRTDDHRIDAQVPVTLAESAWLIRHEFVESLSDLVLRRMSLAIDGRLSMELIDGLTGLLRQELGLSVPEANRQREDLISELETYHGVTGRMLESRNSNRSTICV